MTDTNERRAELFKILSEGGVTEVDRALANEALNRAMVSFMTRKGEPDNGPYLREDLERVCGKGSSVMLLVNEAELAIAAARLVERERCARIAEKMHTEWDILDLCPKIAAQIRTGKEPRPEKEPL
jgi:hypothetical protein